MFNIGGRKSSNMADYGVEAIVPSQKVAKITPADDTVFPGGACRSLWVGTAGTANLILVDGSKIANFPLQQGMNPFAVNGVETGGTADDLWAVY